MIEHVSFRIEKELKKKYAIACLIAETSPTKHLTLAVMDMIEKHKEKIKV